MLRDHGGSIKYIDESTDDEYVNTVRERLRLDDTRDPNLGELKEETAQEATTDEEAKPGDGVFGSVASGVSLSGGSSDSLTTKIADELSKNANGTELGENRNGDVKNSNESSC